MNNKFPVFNMTLPAEGPVSVPLNYDFAASQEYNVDLTELVNNGVISFVSGAWIDNQDNAEAVTLVCNATGMRVVIPANSQAWYSLLATNPPLFTLTTDAAGGDMRILFVNFPVWNSAGVATGGGGGGGGGTSPTGPTFTGLYGATDGTSAEVVAAGDASRYLLIQAADYNTGDLSVNLAGGDASSEYITLRPGGTIDLENGLTNAVTIQGIAGNDFYIFMGA
jgi:hypothetical protein